ncbi:uncharacterized protein N7483_011981 [Penicillium malachiteum]|uniref:uncharacterized protein n=1 Tax=Penicillium malachiteum TaxID=1324776 RepID=UPI002548DB5D|nr:uncharacterized protein N7483_011981 [Penicillium malachiteum]KAJ5714800.1 hypothetical protein N7483_011981 [Penicillium malachiteum]
MTELPFVVLHLCTSNTLVLTSRSILTVVSDQYTTQSAKDYNGVLGKQGETGDAIFQAMSVILIRNTISNYLPLPTSTNLSRFDPHHNGGLSTGAKIAIGVCVPVGVIILTAIAFIVWDRRRRNKTTTSTSTDSQQSPSSGLNGDVLTGKPELDGVERSPPVKQELDTGQDVGALKLNGSTPAELPGNSPVELPVERSHLWSEVQQCRR